MMILEIQSSWALELKDEDVVSFEIPDLPAVINLKFLMEVNYSVWHRDGTQLVFLHRPDIPEEEVDIEVAPEGMSRELVEEELRPTLDWWWIYSGISNMEPIPISDILQWASAQVRRRPPHHNFINITVRLKLNHSEIRSDRIEREPSYMRPAVQSAVEGLKRSGRVSAEDLCLICLEDFSEQGLEEGFLTMPCSHNFHDGCIKRWLGISHYCPTCRYQMPS